MPRNMTVAMALTAALCVAHGVVPSLLYRFLPHPVNFDAYTAAHIIEVVEILAFSFAAFWLLRNFLRPKAAVLLDTDWIYRRPGAAAARLVVSLTGRFFDATDRAAERIVERAVRFSRNPAAALGKLSALPGVGAAGRHREAAGDSVAPGAGRPSTRILLLLILAVFIVLAFLALLSV